MSNEKKSLINFKNVDFKKNPMFFGDEKLGIQRYDVPKYENLMNLFSQQISYFWRPEEINLEKDKADFKGMNENYKFIFETNIYYQILLDSMQSRGISELLKDCTNPEIEAFCKAWEFFETLHSYSYTYIIKNVYPNPSVVFDKIVENEEIKKRATSVAKYYDDLINEIPDDTEFNKKKKLYLTLMSVNILEGIRFYVSFACTFCFAKNKLMEGNAKIIKLIQRDEALHMGFTSNIIRYFREYENEGFQDVVKECEPIVYKMYEDATNEEIEWAQYLFKNGSMLGLNADILTQYMKYLTNKRMKVIGLEPMFGKVSNPIKWIDEWVDSKNTQNAPQETEIISYTSGALKQDFDADTFSEFDL